MERTSPIPPPVNMLSSSVGEALGIVSSLKKKKIKSYTEMVDNITTLLSNF
jgi:hypothetical protein